MGRMPGHGCRNGGGPAVACRRRPGVAFASIAGADARECPAACALSARCGPSTEKENVITRWRFIRVCQVVVRRRAAFVVRSSVIK